MDLLWTLWVDNHVSAWTSRHQIAERLTAEAERVGALFTAPMRWSTVAEEKRRMWQDDPANESGQAALMAMAGGG